MGPERLTARGLTWRIALSIVILVLAVAASTLLGSQSLHIENLWRGDAMEREILFAIRLPRSLLAVLAGGALSLAGVLFQALLRDSLATPDTLGISSGASLGAVIAISIGWQAIGGLPAILLMAFAGAGSMLLLITRIAAHRGITSTSLLLAGITMNSICGALIVFLSSLATFLQSFAITHWLMGSLDSPTYTALSGLAGLILPICFGTWWYARSWNLLAVGEDWANVRGVPAHRMLIVGYILGSLLTGAVTAYTGPIGFVGLIVPHALRLKLGADHRVLVPCAFLLGGAFLAICDLVSRVMLAPTEVPVGVITGLLGGPAFIWMLYTQSALRRS